MAFGSSGLRLRLLRIGCHHGLVILAALITFLLPEAEGATFEFELDHDEKEKKRLDVEAEISFETVITNNKDENRQFALEIINATNLKNREHVIATFDENNDDTASTRTQTVAANGGTVNVIIYIKAKWNALYGFHQATLKASDVDFQEEAFLQLQFVVNENHSVELVNLDPDRDGSTDTEENGGEYTYRLKIENKGNRADKFTVEITDNGWDADLDFERTRVRAYHSHPFNITVTPNSTARFGDEDEIEVRVTSNHNDENSTTKTYTTIVRVKWGLDVQVPKDQKTTKPGESVTFNLDIFNKWTEAVNIQIKIRTKPTSAWSVNLTGYSSSDDLEPHDTFTKAKVQVTPPENTPVGTTKLVTISVHVLQAPDNDMDVTNVLRIKIIVDYAFELKTLEDTFNIPISCQEQLDPPFLLTNDATAEDTFSIMVNKAEPFPDYVDDWNVSVSPHSHLVYLFSKETQPIIISVKVPPMAEEKDELHIILTITSLGSNGSIVESIRATVIAGDIHGDSFKVYKPHEENEKAVPNYVYPLLGAVSLYTLILNNAGHYRELQLELEYIAHRGARFQKQQRHRESAVNDH